MKKFKVFAERTEQLCAIVEAETEQEAIELADTYYSDQDWKEVDGALDTTVDYAEEYTED